MGKVESKWWGERSRVYVKGKGLEYGECKGLE